MNLMAYATVSGFVGVVFIVIHNTMQDSIIRNVRDPFLYNNKMEDAFVYAMIGLVFLAISGILFLLALIQKVRRKKK